MNLFDPGTYAGIRRPLLEAETLPPQCYTSEAFFKREIETIFMKVWNFVGRVDYIPNPGDYYTLDFAGVPLVIVRDDNRRVGAFVNSCRHRGAKVVTGRGTANDPDVVQGRPPLAPENEAPAEPEVKPWEAAPITDEQLRNPINVIPPDQRPRVVLRFSGQNDLLVSGLLNGGKGIAEHAVVVDVPVNKGHVVLFGNNPMYRGETIGSYALVLNTVLNFDHLDAGRKLDAR